MKLHLFFLLLFCSVYVYSQYEYRPGYIVKKDGETENGLINFRSNEFNAKKYEFKKDTDTDADQVVYRPEDIAA